MVKKNQVIFLSFCSLNAHLLWCSLIKTKTHTHTLAHIRTRTVSHSQKRSFSRQHERCVSCILWSVHTQRERIYAKTHNHCAESDDEDCGTNWGCESKRWSLQSRYMLKFMISTDFQRVFFFICSSKIVVVVFFCFIRLLVTSIEATN